MDIEETGRFRHMLLSLREETEKALAAAVETTKPVELDQVVVGRISRIDAIQNQEMALATMRRREQLLEQISQALQRIDAGTYGVCVRCGEDIDVRRLAFNPVVLMCVGCAENRE